MKLIRGLVILMTGFNSLAQEFKEHIVNEGETILAISKSYNIDASEIYRYNRFALEGVSKGMTLKFPVAEQQKSEIIKKTGAINKLDSLTNINTNKVIDVPKPTINVEPKEEPNNSETKNSVLKAQKYTVQQGETLYSLSKRFEVTISEFYEANPGLKEKGLQARQILNIPIPGMVFEKTEIATSSKDLKSLEVTTSVKHKVQKGETLYGLSIKYGVSVDEIKKENESLLKNGLQAGQILIINK